MLKQLSFRAADPVPEIERIRCCDDGIQGCRARLKVTPHITPDQKVRLEIKAKKEQANFTVVVWYRCSPGDRYSQGEHELLVADGDTIVIGGVIEETENLNESRTPGLSQVPIIGGCQKPAIPKDQK